MYKSIFLNNFLKQSWRSISRKSELEYFNKGGDSSKKSHVGGVNRSHNQAWRKCHDLLNSKQSIEAIFFKQSDQARSEYRARLNASIDCIRFLLRQGLAFRGHNESEHSSNQGNFLELLRFLTDRNEDIKDAVLKNAPENLKLTSPEIQKDIVTVASIETCNAIVTCLGDALFFLFLLMNHVTYQQKRKWLLCCNLWTRRDMYLNTFWVLNM